MQQSLSQLGNYADSRSNMLPIQFREMVSIFQQNPSLAHSFLTSLGINTKLPGHLGSLHPQSVPRLTSENCQTTLLPNLTTQVQQQVLGDLKFPNNVDLLGQMNSSAYHFKMQTKNEKEYYDQVQDEEDEDEDEYEDYDEDDDEDHEGEEDEYEDYDDDEYEDGDGEYDEEDDDHDEEDENDDTGGGLVGANDGGFSRFNITNTSNQDNTTFASCNDDSNYINADNED